MEEFSEYTSNYDLFVVENQNNNCIHLVNIDLPTFHVYYKVECVNLYFFTY